MYGRRSLDTKDAGQGLGGIEELGSGNGIVIVGVDGDVDEALLEGVDNGAAGGDRGSRHDGGIRGGRGRGYVDVDEDEDEDGRGGRRKGGFEIWRSRGSVAVLDTACSSPSPLLATGT